MNTHTALLLIDIQNDYFDGGSNPLVGSFEASLKAKDILHCFRDKNLPVIHIQHISERPGSTFFLPGTKGAEIHPHVQALPHEKLIIKRFPNSFRETKLLPYLTQHNVTNLVVCGMMTHMCVDATVRAAKDFGFTCTLLSDACATKNLEVQGQPIKAADVHHSFLAALGYFYATIKKASEFLQEDK